MSKQGKARLRLWLRGIVGGAIGGVSSSFIVVVIDPATFNLTTYGGSGKLLMVFAWAAGFGAFSYLRQHPLPEDDEADVAAPSAPVLCPTCGRPMVGV